MTAAIQLHHDSCAIGRTPILRDISVEIHAGEIAGILGPNGAGKTTLLSLLNGLRRHSAGSITVLGSPLPMHGNALRRRIGVVLQDNALYEELSAEENLQLSAALYAVTDAKRHISRVLDLLQLTGCARQMVRTLSGGMRRRVAIARALLHEPELLIIDEPTLGVDVEARHAIWSHLRLLKSRGQTVVVATNYLDEAQALCDTVLVLRAGRLLTVETPAALIARTGSCLDVACTAPAGQAITAALAGIASVLRVDVTPSGVSVFLDGTAEPEPIMRRVLEQARIDGFRHRAPDLVEIFQALEPSA